MLEFVTVIFKRKASAADGQGLFTVNETRLVKVEHFGRQTFGQDQTIQEAFEY